MSHYKINPYYTDVVVGDLFENFFSALTSEKAYSPPREVVEHDDHITLTLALPGVQKENVSISYLDEHIVVDVNQQQEDQKDDNSKSDPSQLQHIKLKKQYNVGVIDFKQSTATLKDGLLNIQLAKKPKEKPIEIKIK